MIALYTVLIILGLVLVAFEYLYTRWKRIREGMTVYRCTSNLKVCSNYRVVLLENRKYLIDMRHHDRVMRYDFWDYLKDIRTHRVYTEEELDNFD